MNESTPLSQPSRRPQRNNFVVLIVVVATLALAFVWTTTQTQLAGLLLDSDEVFCDVTFQASGFIAIPNKTNDHYFYWFFESRADPGNDPLLLWLSGGPGASSMMALLTENGPCVVDSNGNSTQKNPHSWTSNANVLWVDQPTGTGYSYGATSDYDSTEGQIGANMYAFLIRWLEKYPRFKNRPFYIAGESYAGQYIPVIATTILDHVDTPNNGINLKGIALGNAVVSELVQASHRADLIQENAYNLTLMNDTMFEQYKYNISYLSRLSSECYDKYNKSACLEVGRLYRPSLLEPIVMICGVNPYNMLESAVFGPNKTMPEDILVNPSTLQAQRFLNLPQVQTKLGIFPPKKWMITSPEVGKHLKMDRTMDYEAIIANLLLRKIRVLVYAGNADLVCNWKSCFAWTMHMKWHGEDAFRNAQDTEFSVNGTLAGNFRSASGLTFMQIFRAGHMVPTNQPVVALAMINTFLQGKFV